MKKLQDILISTKTMSVLLLVYAFSMAYATFLENDYGTPAAKALIYESKWFELIMVLLILNFIGNIGRYRLWRREKWPALVFHLAFILIFIGGAITRYISFEGRMTIKEGESSNEIVTDKNFFKIEIEEKGDVLNYQDIPYLMSPLHKNFHAKYQYHGKEVAVRALNYVQRKKDSLVPREDGTEYLHFVYAGQSGRENYYIKSGEAKSVNGTLVTFNRPIPGAIEFRNDSGNLMIKTPEDANFMTMATQATGTTKKDVFQPLALRSLYTINDIRIVVPEPLRKGKLIYVEGDKKKDQELPDMLTVEVAGPKTKQTVDLSVEKGNPNVYKQISLDGMNVILGFGPKIYTTPFALKLDKFVMETYPGSSAPSAYESHVQIIDKGKQTPYNIYMNHVLNYDGYRFYQSSFTPDRKGTELSVNHDFWGTLITYIGYVLLFLGLAVMFFWKGSHFWKLNKNLKETKRRRVAAAVLLLMTFSVHSQKIDMHGTIDGTAKAEVKAKDEVDQNSQNSLAVPMATGRTISADQIISQTKISKEHAEKFGYLLVQNIEGRIVPINTQAIDILRKLYKADEFKGSDGKYLTADQWFLAVSTDTPSWTMVPMIKVDGTMPDKALRAKTKANEDGYTSLMNLFPADASGQLHYILENEYNAAFRKRMANRNEYDNEIIALNDKVQAFNEFFSGQFMRIVPVQNDPNHRWNSWLDENMKPDDSSQKIMAPYFLAVLDAKSSGNWATADEELQKLSDYQQKWGKAVVPSKTKVDLEVFLNKLNINFKLLIFYSILSTFLLVLAFAELFRPNKIIHNIVKVLIGIGVIGYIFHFLGLIARWYISGHAPWSNGYEAVIFISWVGITAGFLLYKNANALIPAAGFMVAVIMMGFAHGASALDPQITPLVPVLKSYWLVVHVAIITSSYGFFALSMIIAVITLFFYIVSNKKLYHIHHDTTLKELTIVSEMSLTIGIFMLTVGTFLGGVWANESWGRYWSWDPKETWAFISVIVYAFVIHMRLVPGLRGRWAFHVAAMFGFCSMVMTYFGVNYYLSGLHSYAKGDPVPVPLWVYLGLAFMVLISALSYYKLNVLKKNINSPNNGFRKNNF